MADQLIVRGAPQTYECKEGILTQLEGLLNERSITKCLIIHGEKSLSAAKSFLPSFETVRVRFENYRGECSLTEISCMQTLVEKESYEAVIGIGGGKVLDLTKAVGAETKVPVILVPTLASSCAAWTPLSVYYTDEGQFIYYRYHTESVNMVLIEPKIILQSPIEYFMAGIGDTLAKWYEADVLIRNLNERHLAVDIAYYSAKTCREILFELSSEAVEDQKKGNLSSAFRKVVETIIMAGGMVGGFGDCYGRIAGAHSIHNGLTQIEETHHLLHGEKVAYGILVQLVLEEKWKDVSELIDLYRKLDLPYSLSDLGLHAKDEDKLSLVAEAAVDPAESIHLMDQKITAENVKEAILSLETYVAENNVRNV
jgi:uncharacterized oxidoreductase